MNAEKTFIVFVIRHRKIKGFYNRGTEMRMEEHAFDSNICVGSYVDVATFASVYKTRGLTDATPNRTLLFLYAKLWALKDLS
jgi:hypothetical protein